MRGMIGLVVAAAFGLSAPGYAATFTLNYTGSGTINAHSGPISVGETGTGTFGLNIDNGTATLANGLNSFTFTVTSKESQCCSAPVTNTYNYNLAMLSSFSATIVNGQVSSFSFLARSSASDYFLASSGTTSRASSGYGIGGTINATADGALPEPSSWALMLGGFGMVGSAMRRRRVTSHRQLDVANQ